MRRQTLLYLYIEAKFLDEIQTKDLRIFLLAIQSHLYSFALRFLFLQTYGTSYSFCSALLYTVKEKGGKPDRKPHPLPRNSYRNLKSENSQNYAPKNPKKLYVHEFGFFIVYTTGLTTWRLESISKVYANCTECPSETEVINDFLAQKMDLWSS
jgi:hypothetical protein